jgi:hypothetical protein
MASTLSSCHVVPLLSFFYPPINISETIQNLSGDILIESNDSCTFVSVINDFSAKWDLWAFHHIFAFRFSLFLADEVTKIFIYIFLKSCLSCLANRNHNKENHANLSYQKWKTKLPKFVMNQAFSPLFLYFPFKTISIFFDFFFFFFFFAIDAIQFVTISFVYVKKSPWQFLVSLSIDGLKVWKSCTCLSCARAPVVF